VAVVFAAVIQRFPYTPNQPPKSEVEQSSEESLPTTDDGKQPHTPLLEPPRPTELKTSITNSIGMEFVLIQPGEYEMGSTDGYKDEQPVYTVRLSQSFYLGRYEVTQGKRALCGGDLCGRPHHHMLQII